MSIVALCYEVVYFCCILGNDIDGFDFDDDDVDTGHGSSAAAGLKKRKTLPPPNRRTLAAPTQEVPTAPAIGFSNTWPIETGTAHGGSYPNWP
jgi:hypothetical protein